MDNLDLELERVIVPKGGKDHSQLQNLDYENSGHRGFASTEQLNATNEKVSTLEEQVQTNASAIQALSEGIDPEKIDGIKDLIDYVEEHEVDVISIQEGIEQNANDIDTLEEKVTALEESGSSTPSGEPLVATFDINIANKSITVKNLTGATSVDWGDGSPIEDISSITSYSHTYVNKGIYVSKFYGSITSVGTSAFEEATRIIKAKIPYGVKTIAHRAFADCRSLLEIDLPDGLETIGGYVFLSNVSISSMERITIPSSVKSIGGYAFGYNTGLKQVEFLGSQPTIETSTFPTTTKIIVPYTYLEAYKTASNWSTIASQIDAYALASEASGGGDTEELEKRVDSLELLHQDPLVATFKTSTANTTVKCRNLTGATSVDWGDGSDIEDISAVSSYSHVYASTGTFTARFYGNITVVGRQSFYADNAGLLTETLRSVFIPQNVTEISNQAFYNCAYLVGVEFGHNSALTTIGQSAFYGCRRLINIDIPSTVTYIKDSAFYNCESISQINLGNRLTIGLEASAFGGCKSLTSISLPSYKALSNTPIYSIPANLFQNCLSLKNILIPSYINSIGSSAFDGCESLEEVHIYYGANGSATVKPFSIGFNSFSGCLNLRKVIFDKGIDESYDDYTITISNRIFSDKTSSFPKDRILEIRSDKPPKITGINYIQDDIKIIVPRSSLEAYKNADGWKDKASQIDSEITTNEVYALVGNINTELANIIEGEGV